MFEMVKYGTSKYGKVWVLGNLKYDGFEVCDIFNTNIDDEKYFEDKTTIKIKKFKISRNSKTGKIVFYLEF